MTVRIIVGDALDQLRLLPGGSAHCCVTSPPYYGLRDYGCAGQIGIEPSPDDYIAALVAVFREVRRVLRPDGTLWVVIGDSYSGHNLPGWRPGNEEKNQGSSNKNGVGYVAGTKPKDLLGIPWMLAFALRADGWYLRQDIIWSKPNPMPESVTDRCTKAHEYLFLLSKSERYWFDAAAIQEPLSEASANRYSYAFGGAKTDALIEANKTGIGQRTRITGERDLPQSRNKRSVWTVASQAFPESHFATFPPALIEPAILAGCPRDCCSNCGAPWVRHVERETRPNSEPNCNSQYPGYRGISGGVGNDRRAVVHRGFEPACVCGAASAVSGTVLDPFGGAGTTGLVADRLGRSAILIELNPLYAGMAERRIWRDGPLFADVAIEAAAD